ncbi:MAG: hypothetical protein LQ346_004104 [Caloplaca aetnensis]|nr:MAG: hypothetical protein LQ346_004104 [Caloplaca aetnensis]
MSSAGSISCILPLLDGDAEASPRVIAVDSVSGDVGDLQKLYREDKAIFDSYVCTAWALLLRCYTGLDLVRFEFFGSASQNEDEMPSEPGRRWSSVQLALQDDEPLTKIVERATTNAASPDSNLKKPVLGDVGEPGTRLSNTRVLIYRDQVNQVPVADTHFEIPEASHPTAPASALKAGQTMLIYALEGGFPLSTQCV